MRWRDVPKIDAHTHVVLHERPDTDLVLNTPDQMLAVMDEHRVEQAVVLPINYPAYFPLTEERQRDWLPANNDRQADLMRESAGRFVAFADCALGGSYDEPGEVVSELERAVRTLGLRGLKIHPSNLKVAADDRRLEPIVQAAARLEIPVMFHSNPCAFDVPFDLSAPARLYQLLGTLRLAEKVPIVIAHMGGFRFLDLMGGYGYVDFSGTLLDMCDLYGVPFAERLLRAIGLDRVLFGTDYPIHPYEQYYAVLDRMRFTPTEVERIAYANAARLLGEA